MNPMQMAAVAIFVYMTGVFLIALRVRDNSIVDVAWGGGFLMVVAVVTGRSGLASGRQILIGVLISVWALRLLLHIHTRNRGRSGEDFRYRQWRETWGRWFVLRSYLQIFMLQGVVMWVVAMPILIAGLGHDQPLGPVDAAGGLVWLFGFLFESVGDWQLLRFKRDPANQGGIITTGLWRFTRHPNYFGEVVVWWGLFLIALGAPHGWWALISPVTITFLLLRVSGIPMLEKKYEGRADFAHYRAVTNAFLPWFPKKRSQVDSSDT